MTRYVAYFRVSTARQGQSGLGLEAQQAAVQRFLPAEAVRVADYVEVESGRKSARPQLAAAIALAQREGAVLLDLHMPGLDGLATTQRLQAEFPDVHILILSMADYALAIGEVLAAGAQGYVLKNAGHDEIVVGVRTVAAGKRFLCSELGLIMLGKVLTGTPEPAPKSASGPTAREQEILRLVADELTTAQIAEQLYTSPRTVESHRQNIMAKTGTKNTAALVKAAVSQGWLS